jgi:hypothetical protein
MEYSSEKKQELYYKFYNLQKEREICEKEILRLNRSLIVIKGREIEAEDAWKKYINALEGK